MVVSFNRACVPRYRTCMVMVVEKARQIRGKSVRDHTELEISTEMAKKRPVCGFECEFVEPPPKFFRTECPICLHVLREPCQVSCCGKCFCYECLDRVRDSDDPACPYPARTWTFTISQTSACSRRSMSSKSTARTRARDASGRES